MQSHLREVIERYIAENKKKKRTCLLLSALSVLMAFSVYGALCLPAVSMTKEQPFLDAETLGAVYGDAISFRVRAEAPQGKKPTAFVLHTESIGAGLSDIYTFDETEDEDDDICLIETEEGNDLELHRVFKGKGTVDYWFSLEPEERVSFTLECSSDMYAVLEEEMKERKEEEAQEEILEEELPEEEETEEEEVIEDETEKKEPGIGGSGGSGQDSGNKDNGSAETDDKEAGNGTGNAGTGDEEAGNGTGTGGTGTGDEEAGNGTGTGNAGTGDEEAGNGTGTGNAGTGGEEAGNGTGTGNAGTGGEEAGTGTGNSGTGGEEAGADDDDKGKNHSDTGENSGKENSAAGTGTKDKTEENTGKENTGKDNTENKDKGDGDRGAAGKEESGKTKSEKEDSKSSDGKSSDGGNKDSGNKDAGSDAVNSAQAVSNTRKLFLPAYALDRETAGGESRATASDAVKATGSDAEQKKQYLRIYGGTGKKYASALHAARSKNNSLELFWSDTYEETVLTAETESGITVILRGPSDSFPEGNLRLVATEVADSATPSNAGRDVGKETEASPSDAEESGEEKIRSEWHFDICIMDGDREVQPLGPVNVSFEGLVKDPESAEVEVYHVDDKKDTSEDMGAWTNDEGNVVMRTTHFSRYDVKVSENEPEPELEDLVEGFGIANQFAVFANYYEGKAHMEGSIAVQEMKVTSENLVIGNTENVGSHQGTHYGKTGRMNLCITKKIEGRQPEEETVYSFGIYDVSTKKKIIHNLKDEDGNSIDADDLEIAGEGSIKVELDSGNYFVRELGEDGEPLEEGEGTGFSVSYDGINHSNSIGTLNNGSYIERFQKGTPNYFSVAQADALYIGKENTITKGQNSGYYEITSADESLTVEARGDNDLIIAQPTGIDWDASFSRLYALSEKLAGYTTTYDYDNPSPGVKVLNIKVPADGRLTAKGIGEAAGNPNVNDRFNFQLAADQYLIVNLDCSDVTKGTVIHVPEKVGVNNAGPGEWNTGFCRLLWNFTDGGECYDGKAEIRGSAFGGTVLMPAGEFTQGQLFNGSVMADRVYRADGSSEELHQHSFRLNGFAQTTITNTYPGQSLEILKKDKDGSLLPGAKFRLVKADTEWKPAEPEFNAQTDSAGKLIFKNLPAGNYLLYEQSAPEGYITPFEPWMLTVTEDGIVFLDNPDDVQVSIPESVTEDAASQVTSATIVNRKKTGTAIVKVEKQWAGDLEGGQRPEQIEVQLLQNGQVMEEKQVILRKDNEWKAQWTGLPKADEDGKAYDYTVQEIAVEGYVTTVTKTEEEGAGTLWAPVDSFTDGKTYMLVSGEKMLANKSNSVSDLEMRAVDWEKRPEDTALWTASVSRGAVRLMNADHSSVTRQLGLLYNYNSGYKIYAMKPNDISLVSSNFYYSSNKIYTTVYGNYGGYTNYYLTSQGATTPSYYSAGDFQLYELREAEDVSFKFVITNTKDVEITENPEFPLEHKKTIDAFRDDQDNPDTSLDNTASDKTDLYRLYLDVQGDQYTAPVDLLLIIDNSGSMVQDGDQNQMLIDGERRLTVLNRVLSEEDGFVDSFLSSKEGNRIATVYFSGPETQIYEGYKPNIALFPDTPQIYKKYYMTKDYKYHGDAWVGCKWNSNFDVVKESLISTSPNGGTPSGASSQAGTNYAAGLRKAVDLLGQSDENHLRHIIFLSDGVPTYYLMNANGSGNLMGTIRGGTGYYGQAGDCVVPTEKAIDQFKKKCDLPISTIRFGNESNDTENTRKDLLERLVNRGGSYYEADSTSALTDALDKMSFHKVTNVSITDRLSQYVEWYGRQPDVLVTKKDKDGKVTKLWQGSGSGESGNVGHGLPGNRTVQDGKSIDIVNSVEFTPQPENGRGETTGTVTVHFNPAYELEEGSTYTLSFNVKTTKTAYEEYSKNLGNGGSANGYGDVKGDPETDYGPGGTGEDDGWCNETSSEKAGFHSNQSADVSYVLDEESHKESYDHPVVQVASCALKIQKTDMSNMGICLANAGFDLYRKSGPEDAGEDVPIPGTPDTDAARGVRINQETLFTDEKGELLIQNLMPDVYYLVETVAPSGYQLLTEPIVFDLKQDGVDVLGDGSQQNMVEVGAMGDGQIPVLFIKNSDGFELPHTGGTGTLLYRIVGLLLIAAAALYIVRKRSGGRGAA